MKKEKNNQSGFTLTETLVALAIFISVSVSLYAIYVFIQRAYFLGETRAEIVQNGRVILERISREIRQARGVVTVLADDESGATSTILFEDGHDTSTIQYIHYFKDDGNVEREKIAYYFSGNPSKFVSYNATPPAGQQRLSTTTEAAQVIGEYVTILEFWGSPLINISLTLKKGSQQIDLETKVLGRNL